MKQNARALAFFEKETLQSEQAVTDALKGKNEKQKFTLLKEAIEVYWHGYGCCEAKAKWSKGGKPVKSAVLGKHLLSIIKMVDDGRFTVPATAPAGRSHVRAVKVLGTLTAQKKSIVLMQQQEVSGPEALAYVEAEKERRKARDRDEHALEQPEQAPLAAVGMHVEVLTALVDSETGADMGTQWLPGVVKCISDGQQDVFVDGKRKRGKPVGWACIRFDDGYEDWYIAGADTFNNRALRSWRIDLDYGKGGTVADG